MSDVAFSIDFEEYNVPLNYSNLFEKYFDDIIYKLTKDISAITIHLKDYYVKLEPDYVDFDTEFGSLWISSPHIYNNNGNIVDINKFSDNEWDKLEKEIFNTPQIISDLYKLIDCLNDNIKEFKLPDIVEYIYFNNKIFIKSSSKYGSKEPEWKSLKLTYPKNMAEIFFDGFL